MSIITCATCGKVEDRAGWARYCLACGKARARYYQKTSTEKGLLREEAKSLLLTVIMVRADAKYKHLTTATKGQIAKLFAIMSEDVVNKLLKGNDP